MTHIDKRSFQEILANVDKFEAYLSSNDIHVHPQSGLGKQITTARELLNLFESQAIPNNYPHHDAMNSMANISCLSAIVLGSKGKPFEKQLLSKILALKSGSAAPLMPHSRSQADDTVLELLCGYTCTQFAEDVIFDEPDIYCSFEGETWGLACKSAYGTPKTIAAATRDGVKQLNKVNVDKGFVLVDLTNLFPHEEMYHYNRNADIITSLHNKRSVRTLFNDLLHYTAQSIEAERVQLFRRYDPEKHWRVRGILYVAHTVGYFRGTRMIMGSTDFQWLSNIKANSELPFVVEFNSAWQKLAWPE